jgi:hypothetical protein
MKLTKTELRVVRAALLLAVDEDSEGWDTLTAADVEVAQDLIDAIPDFDFTNRDEEEDEDDAEEDADEDY